MMFYRFHTECEELPDFSSRPAWYNIKLLNDTRREDAITYGRQATEIRKAFKHNRISTNKVTHAMREGGARFAITAGCSIDSVRKHGRWCGDRLTDRYLSPLSLQPVRALAGFQIAGGDHWLEREAVVPNEELQSKVCKLYTLFCPVMLLQTYVRSFHLIFPPDFPTVGRRTSRYPREDRKFRGQCCQGLLAPPQISACCSSPGCRHCESKIATLAYLA